MVEVPDRVQRLGEQAADGLTQLAAAASEGASTLGKDARIAQGRADAALRALRGKEAPKRWRWLVVGLFVGVAAGVALSQRLRVRVLEGDQNGRGVVDAARDTSRAAAGAVRESTASARAKATQLREKLPGTQTDDRDAADQ